MTTDPHVPTDGAARRHTPLPHLFDASLARFAPTPKERWIVGGLLRLLRWPGTTRLIRAWHSARSR